MKRSDVRMALIAGAACALLTTGAALAGSMTIFPALVDTAGKTAMGNLASAFNTPEFLNFIGCEVTIEGVDTWGQCIARNEAGDVGACTTLNPDMIAAINSVSAESFVRFEWDNFGNCTLLNVWNGSDSEIRVPRR